MKSNLEVPTPSIACLVRYNGARHASGYGLLHADFQVRMAALAFNLKRWATLMLSLPRM